MRIVLRSTSFLAAIVLGLLLVSPASAQGPASRGPGDPRAEARTLFSEGVIAMEGDDFAAAAAKFEQALVLHSAPSIEYNLGSAYFQLGRLGEAGDLAASVAVNPEADEALQAHAQALEAQIAERAGTLTIEVSGDANATATVTIDAYTVPQERVGVARYESPGDHAVILHREDGSTEERSISVTQGAPERVTFGPPLLHAAGNSSNDDDSIFSSPLFWVLAGAGAALIIVAIVVAAATSGPDAVGGDYDPAVLRF